MTESKYWSLKPFNSNLTFTSNDFKKLVKQNNISLSN